ncbi:hypothetical protein Q7C_1852 [Methylophaga frappieri]|uniref:Uncharacterized protein n=1 Tax=Methylophaga frappieri (strain ATCC BAA-2434 / DSM 25690 / JAM7) TaxID=754477 RepID=I1YJA0_METFJ|nr:hypothetical protein Q7C_1852 [Methylophaga frappieri]
MPSADQYNASGTGHKSYLYSGHLASKIIHCGVCQSGLTQDGVTLYNPMSFVSGLSA